MGIYLLQGLLLAFYATVSPGPFQAFLLSRALNQGWKRTLPIAMVPLLTDGPISLMVLLILTQTPQGFLNMLRVAGGFFILYLAFQGLSTLKMKEEIPFQKQTSDRGVLSGMVMNFLNPNPYIFWGVVGGPIFLVAWRESPWLGIGFVAGFYGSFVCGLAALIMLFSMAGRIGPRVTRALSGISGIILLGFGIYQITAGIRSFF